MGRARLASRAVLLAPLLVPSAFAQQSLLRWQGDPGDPLFGVSTIACGDVDGDGRIDVAATEYQSGDVRWYSGADAHRIRTATVPGQVFLHDVGDLDGDAIDDVAAVQWGTARIAFLSGADGSLIYDIVDRPDVGASVERMGDVDGDGVEDFAVTRPYADAGDPNNPGHVSIRSGATGDLICDVVGEHDDDAFGLGLAVLDDLDADGVRDLAIGAPGHSPGYVDVRSGATGARIRKLTFSVPGYDLFADRMAVTSDLDGDGRRDFALRELPHDVDVDPYRIAFVSSVTGVELAHADAPLGWTAFGHALRNAGDVDGDGVEDLLASIFYDRAELFSGATFEMLYSFEFGDPDAHLASLGAAGDLDGDGRGDVLRSSYGGSSANGTVDVFSGNDLFLDATPTVVGAGDFLARTLRPGVPGNPALVVLMEVNGSPLWFPLGPIVFFDATGTVDTSVVVPPGLAGFVLGFRGFARDARGKIATSSLERVEFR
jgi:hypothetical protein